MRNFRNITQQYLEQYRLHGDSPASLLCAKGRQDLRFRAIDQFIDRDGLKVLDYGCGLGHLREYLDRFDRDISYFGLDIVDEFISACRSKYGGRGEFQKVEPEMYIEGDFDITFASGVFNICSGDSLESRAYAYQRIENLFSITSSVLICDFLSGYVDFQQPDAQHFSVGEIADFCVERLSRRFVIRHDLRPYEFTLIVFKNDCIQKPDSIFCVDGG